MFKLNLISFCDAPKPWGMYFQDSASPQMEVLVELHNNIMFYLVIISFGVALILLSRIINYVSNKSWTLFSSTGNAISTNTKLSMVSKILSAFYQYNKYKNMRNQIRNKVDIVFCAVRPNTLVSIEGKKLRIDRQAVFVYCKTPLVNWTHLILDNPLLSYECYVLNAGTLKIGKWASVTIDGRHCNGYLYLNDIPNDINYWNVVCIQYNKMAYINIEQTCDITTMGYHVRHQFQSGDLPGGKFKILHLIAIKNSFATAKDVQNFKSRL